MNDPEIPRGPRSLRWDTGEELGEGAGRVRLGKGGRVGIGLGFVLE